MNLSTGRVLVIVALIVGGLAVLANGFTDSGSAAAPSLSPSPTSGGHSSTSSPPPTEPPSPTSPTPAPETKGVLFMAMNGTNVTGAGAAAQTVLTDAGYTATKNAIDAPTGGITKTIVYYRDDQDSAQNQSNANYVGGQVLQESERQAPGPEPRGRAGERDDRRGRR